MSFFSLGIPPSLDDHTSKVTIAVQMRPRLTQVNNNSGPAGKLFGMVKVRGGRPRGYEIGGLKIGDVREHAKNWRRAGFLARRGVPAA